MKRPFNLANAVVISVALVCSTSALASGVQVRFNVQNPQDTPFPSDLFSIEDPHQNTDLRVNLPFPDCSKQVSDCELIEQINLLDGFNLQPRLSIPFTGPIDVETVSSETVFLIHLGSTLSHSDDDMGKVIGINQVVLEPKANTLHVESDEFLDQHTHYALIVTRGVRDSDGVPISARAFEQFRRKLESEPELNSYRQALHLALRAAQEVGIRNKDVAAASVFTTQSITSFLEKVRDQIKAGRPEPAEFDLGVDGTRTVFPLKEVMGIVVKYQYQVELDKNDDSVFSNDTLKEMARAGSEIAFGKYHSPDYRRIEPQTSDFVIPSVPTRSGNPQVFGDNEVFFNIFLPAGDKPHSGWPIAIFGHGGSLGKNDEFVFDVAATLANHGIATIAINALGHGGGKEGTISIEQTTGDTVSFSAGGRGLDVDNDGFIGIDEGFAFQNLDLFRRDGFRQTAIDLMQLARVIEGGIDVNADGIPDFDASRLYYAGISLGGGYGPLFLAVEPAVSAAVFNVPLAASIDFRLAPGNRGAVEFSLSISEPPLTNVGNPNSCEADDNDCDLRFDENLPLRNQPPVINDVPGAMDIQTFLDRIEWTEQSGTPVAYVTHLQKKPLIGVPAKPLIVQFARGDTQVPNASTTSLIRAGDLVEHSTLYRHDLVFSDLSFGEVPANPHNFLFSLSLQNPLLAFIPLAAQQQIAEFFASDGTLMVDPDGPEPVFETPIAPPLPENCGFVVEISDFKACQ